MAHGGCEGRPTFLAFVDKELKRLEGLNILPDHKKLLKAHLESLKTDNPTPFPFPKPKPGSLVAGTSTSKCANRASRQSGTRNVINGFTNEHSNTQTAMRSERKLLESSIRRKCS
jgi:hypothetical protein